MSTARGPSIDLSALPMALLLCCCQSVGKVAPDLAASQAAPAPVLLVEGQQREREIQDAMKRDRKIADKIEANARTKAKREAADKKKKESDERKAEEQRPRRGDDR